MIKPSRGWLDMLQAEDVYSTRVAGRNPAVTLLIAGSEETCRNGEITAGREESPGKGSVGRSLLVE